MTTTELEALNARMRQLHADWLAWLADPTKPVAPILLQALTLSMDLMVGLSAAEAENGDELDSRPASQRRLDD